MKKFILVDQSIASIAGHHYEYAVHVLEAAEKAGYEPVLATNVEFRNSKQKTPWKTHCIYHYGFWASHGAANFSLLRWIRQSYDGIRFRWKFARQFSLSGLLWSVRDNFTDFLVKQPLSRQHLAPLILVTILGFALKFLRFTLAVLTLPFALAIFLVRGIGRLLLHGGFPQGYIHSLTADAKDIGTLIKRLVKGRNLWLGWIQQYRHLTGFRKDTQNLLEKTGAGEGDIIFIPTLSFTELIGLGDLIARGGAAHKATWHLLFRRDIYWGRRVDYPQQIPGANNLRQILAKCQTKMRGATVRFYTDTDELTQQYNSLGIFPFHTVPIPHTRPVEARRAITAGPVRVIYVGDARSEKGYQHIPRLIEQLWDDYVLARRVTFHLQSNFNIPAGEPAIAVAREQLELMAKQSPGSIELIKHPLTSEQYRDLVLSGDLNLLLYQSNNYFARSSGILVESLSAGMPVIVPAGSWLARQFREPLQKWQTQLPRKMRVAKFKVLHRCRWRVHGSLHLDPMAGGELTAGHRNRSFCWIKVPEGSTHVLFRAVLSTGVEEAALYIDQKDSGGNCVRSGPECLLEPGAAGRATLCLPLESDTAKLLVAISATRPGLSVRVSRLEILFLQPRQGVPPPPSFVIGAVYHHTDQIPGLVREMLDYHEHYRATARDFARDWHQYHNAPHLIEALQSAPGNTMAEATVA